LAGQQHPPAIAYRTSGNCGVMEQGDRTAALNCNTDPTQQIIAFQCQGSNVGPAGHLRAGNGNETGGVPFIVRRLTPRECERLQGFPDDYTLIDFRGKPAKDGPRYKALGNSMAVPVMRWIGQRIMELEAVT
jgi:DNA (cytosine-5)-methyltransferase 1